jgi:hypothetical protein
MLILKNSTLDYDLDFEDITKPNISFEVLHPRISVAKYEQNPSRGF